VLAVVLLENEAGSFERTPGRRVVCGDISGEHAGDLGMQDQPAGESGDELRSVAVSAVRRGQAVTDLDVARAVCSAVSEAVADRKLRG